MSLTAFVVPTFTQMLRGVSAWLDKAAAAKRAAGLDPDALLRLRLAADMYPLAAQIRFVAFQAQEPIYLLQGLPVPDALLAVRTEGWRAGQQPGALSEAQAYISDAIRHLTELAPVALDTGADVPISLTLPDGLIVDMTGTTYVRDWALPQFYFHVMTTYAILRHHGVDLGKVDYVPYMTAYLRSGTVPKP